MTIKNIFSAVAVMALTLVSNPVSAQNEGVELLENKGYDQLASLKQTEPLGNTYNTYLKRTDKETGEVERWLLSSKPTTGLAGSAGVRYHNYHGYGDVLPFVGLSWIAPHVIIDGEVGYGKTQYRDPESNLYGQTYNMVVAELSLLWKFYRSSAQSQYLEKWYLAVGPYAEYDNRRNSFATTSETATEVTETVDRVQGSSYAIGGRFEGGINFPKVGGQLAVGGYYGTARDYEGSGTVSCGTWGIYGKLRILLFSKTKYTRLGLLKKNNPEKFKQILNAY